jgi:hypothetical protein
MRLTLHTDYALRVLLYVGLNRDTLTTIPEIVRHFDLDGPCHESSPAAREEGISANDPRQKRWDASRAGADGD